VGILLAAGNLLSCVFQPVLADRADRIGGNVIKWLTLGLTTASALCFVSIQLLQATSYTFLSPIQMYYANNKIGAADMVKGQAFITASYTLGCAAGNFTGGQLISAFGVRVMLIAGIIMAVAGTVVFFLTVEKKDI